MPIGKPVVIRDSLHAAVPHVDNPSDCLGLGRKRFVVLCSCLCMPAPGQTGTSPPGLTRITRPLTRIPERYAEKGGILPSCIHLAKNRRWMPYAGMPGLMYLISIRSVPGSPSVVQRKCSS